MDRTLRVLAEHRQFMEAIRSRAIASLVRIDDYVARRRAAGQDLSLKEEVMISMHLQRSSAAVAALIAHERRAHGIQDGEAPSELELLTNEEMAEVIEIFTRILGRASES